MSPWPARREGAAWILWLILLVCIPVTSFPAISTAGGSETPVAPLAAIPLVGLGFLVLVPHFLRLRPLPRAAAPLLVFGLLCLVSVSAAAFIGIEPYQGETVLSREVRALATLALGVAFYLCAALLPRTRQGLEGSLRAITWGGIVLLAWSAVQASVVLRRADHVPLIITQLQHWISVRDPLVDRVTGMAYEPSWLGNQLAVLYLPIWFAQLAASKGGGPRWGMPRWATGLLLLIGVATLLLTRSRISLLSLLGTALVVGIVAGWSRSTQWIRDRLPARIPWKGWVANGVTGVALIVFVAAAVLGAGWWVRQTDRRMAALGEVAGRIPEAQFLYPHEAVYDLANRLAFAERLVYWTAALRTFAEYPWLGVGPGNAGFFFEANRPGYGYELTEIRNVLEDRGVGFPNPKNLWLRVLAENGILGFAAFSAWFGLMGVGGLWLWRRGTGVERVLGLAGILACGTQIVEGFSLDTYALPQIWIVLGLVTAAAWGRDRDSVPIRTTE